MSGTLAKNIKKNRVMIPYFFIAPAIILLVFFMILPLLYSFYMSCLNWDGVLKSKFVGLENYIKLFKDPVFYKSLENNLKFTFFTVIITVVFGFLFAVAIERRLKGWKIYKFVYFLPVMLSLTVVGSLFNKILEPSNGILNMFLDMIGLDMLQNIWLGDAKIAIYSIVGVSGWQYCGFTMVLFLTALEDIPTQIHDAATIDGVNGFQRIIYINFPCIKRVFYVVTMAQIIFTCKVFDIVWIMTQGGPGVATEVMGTFMYRTAFRERQFGYASAIAVIMLVVISLISLAYIKVSKLGTQEIE